MDGQGLEDEMASEGGGGPWFLHVRPTLGEDGSSFKPSLSYCEQREKEGERERETIKDREGVR